MYTNERRTAGLAVPGETSNARGRMLMRQTKGLLSLIAVVLIAACTENGITNPFSDAAGTYTLTVYDGRTPPATYQIQPGDPNYPQYPNGATYVVTDGDFVLRSDGSLTETNFIVITPNGGSQVQTTFSRDGTYQLNGSQLTLFFPAQNGFPAMQDSGTLVADFNGRYTINYQESDGAGGFSSFEYKR